MGSTPADWRVRAGLVAGREHLLDGRNCQDALCHLAFEARGERYLVGVVADGCGSGRRSEVGAALAVQFIPREVRRLVVEAAPPEELPALLFARTLRVLETLIGAYPFATPGERAAFVADHLLFTLIGFIIAPQQTLVFALGDGLVIINDEHHYREQQNTPDYIGYHLVAHEHSAAEAAPLPDAFELTTLPTAALQRLAIGSDAWLQEREALGEIWGLRSPAGLQLMLNRLSAQQHFKDDASLIVVERAEGGER